MNASLAPLRNTKTILLTTYKPTGPAAHRLMRYRTMHYELIPP
ncbi:MAG TPA: hypothetical protein VFQ68_18380 [Streptosporangiaceae bacterium]|nr:hypothetical protein [Streptosporangiaceae bacterium]